MSARGDQDRLWITDPRRKTCIARVTEVRADRFTVDRALFAPRSRACRHPQAPDKGTVWIEGEKRRLEAIEEIDGRVWYRLRGTVPPLDAELQCELDQETRALTSRGHTAMHLLLAAFGELDAPPMVQDPEVKGDGHVRFTFAWPAAPALLGAVIQRCQAVIDQDLPLQRAFAVRAEVERFLTPQRFQPPDPVPGGDVLPVVRVPDVCAYPCDGTQVARTKDVGDVVVVHAQAGKDGFVVTARAVDR